MPTTTQRLLDAGVDPAGATVADARLGLGYTAILLDDGRAGLAYTLREGLRGGCTVFDRLRPLQGRPAAELLPLLGAADALERAVGLACLNALVNTGRPELRGGDVLEHLAVGSTDAVVMVGHFGPLAGPLRERARALTIFDRDQPGAGVSPPEQAEAALRRADVALITATTLLNGTLDALLEAARGCREVALLGPSTPLHPAAFAGGPVTLLSGVVVADPAAVLRVVSEGGGTRWFGPHVRKVARRVREPASEVPRGVPWA